MLDIKSTVTEAAHHVTERLARVATGALDAFTSSVSRAGLSVVDGVLAKASALVGGANEETEASVVAAPPSLEAAPHGKAAGKKRKQARMAMQKLVKAAKRGASSARHHAG